MNKSRKDKNKTENACDQLMKLIQSGKFAPGSKLPGERPLAERFKVSYITMRNAVDMLVDRQVLEKIHGSGTYVTKSAMVPNIGIVTGINTLKLDNRPFIRLILENLKQRAIEHQTRLSSYLFFGDTEFEKEIQYKQLMDDIHKNRIQSLIFEPVIYKSKIIKIHKTLIPVTIGSASAYELNTVNLDFDMLINLAMKTFHQLGIRKIAFVNAFTDGKNIDLKLSFSNIDKTFEETSSQLGIPLPKVYDENTMLEKLLQELIAGKFNGIIFNDDGLAKRFLDHALIADKKVGRDFMVATHSNRDSILLEPYIERVIRLEYDSTEIAESLLELAVRSGQKRTREPLRKAILPKLIMPDASLIKFKTG